MKSSMFLGALCALGAAAQEVKNPSEVQPSYVTTWTTTTVTDWTTQTITKTITVKPTSTAAPTSTTVSVPDAHIKVPQSSTSSAEPTTTAESTTTQAPAQTEEPEQTEQPAQTAWSTAWESIWTPTESATQSATQTSTEETAQTQAPAPANGYQGKVLHSHNIHRANHSSDALTWSADLEKSAQVLASRCVYQHDTDIAPNANNYGQNIGYGTSADEVGVMISNLMYNDEMGYYENLYGEATPDMSLFEKWGHFSQIVWKGTKEVGCATAVCNSLGNVDSTEALPFTVCNYSPAGNVPNEYGDNILKPLGKALFSAE